VGQAAHLRLIEKPGRPSGCFFQSYGAAHGFFRSA
jgi:hypothetical protein